MPIHGVLTFRFANGACLIRSPTNATSGTGTKRRWVLDRYQLIPHGPVVGDAEGDTVAVASTGRVLSTVVVGCVLSIISGEAVRSIGFRAGVGGALPGE